VLKTTQGRWSGELNAKAEAQAKLEFKKVYNRSAVMSDNKDANVSWRNNLLFL
jgi:outer membrane cobalamin receptor